MKPCLTYREKDDPSRDESLLSLIVWPHTSYSSSSYTFNLYLSYVVTSHLLTPSIPGPPWRRARHMRRCRGRPPAAPTAPTCRSGCDPAACCLPPVTLIADAAGRRRRQLALQLAVRSHVCVCCLWCPPACLYFLWPRTEMQMRSSARRRLLCVNELLTNQ